MLVQKLNQGIKKNSIYYIINSQRQNTTDLEHQRLKLSKRGKQNKNKNKNNTH